MCKKIQMLDVFAGIGGFHIGVQQACEELNIDFECVGAIEFDKNAQETYKANFPSTPLLGMDVGGDITKMDLTKLPKHNMLCGGFPCQGFSRGRHNRSDKAGIHAKIPDKRVNLFRYLCKILLCHRPKYFIFENVSGILKEVYKNGKRVVDIIIKTIEKCGYDVKLTILNTKDFGSPQSRERVIFIGKIKSKSFYFDENFDLSQFKCIEDILEDSVEDKYLLSNLWKNIKNHKLKGNRYDAIIEAYNSNRWIKPSTKCNRVVTSARVEGDTPSGCSRQRDRVFNSLGLSPTLVCSTAISISIDKLNILRQLTPREYARIQCFPDSFKLHKKDGCSYSQFGNAVCPNMIKAVAKKILC